jgi:sugar/nucleoside kinase (ribokinase family)
VADPTSPIPQDGQDGQDGKPKRRRRGGVAHRKKRDASLPPAYVREPIRGERARPTAAQSAKAPDYLVIGHICADLLEDGTAVLGGTSIYSALTAANLGLRVGVITRGKYGQVADGIAIPGLEEYADRIQIIVQDADHPTIFVNRYSGGRRTQHVRSWAGEIDLKGIPPHWLNAKIIHLGPICQEIDLRTTGILQPEFLGATPQGWMRDWRTTANGLVKHIPLRLPADLMSRLDAVIVSDEEIAQAREVVEWVGARRLGVVTLGDQGARIIYGGARADLPGFPIKTVDLTGAGDVFATAFFVKASDRSASAIDAGRFANATAALSLTGIGPTGVPTRAEVEALLATNSDLRQLHR